MELAFEDRLHHRSESPEPVSILLVVELAFEVVVPGCRGWQHLGFNPSCSGIGF